MFLLYIKDSNLCSGHLYKWITNFWPRLAHLIHLHPSITQQSGHHSGASQYMFIEMRGRVAKPPLCVDSSWSTLSVFGDPSTFHFLFLLLPYHPSKKISVMEWMFKAIFYNTVVVACACNSNSWEVGEEGLSDLVEPGLLSELQASLGYMVKCCLKKSKGQERVGGGREEGRKGRGWMSRDR